KIKRAIVTGGTPAWEEVGAVNSDTFAFDDANLQPNTTYQYQVFGYVAGSSNPFGTSNIANATTAPKDSSFVLQEVITIPVDGSSVSSNTVLESGAYYEITASGYMNLGGPNGAYRADAEYGFWLPN